MAAAICKCDWCPEGGATTGTGSARMGSGSSSSSEVRHFLHKLLVVRNWTRWQWSHLTTSRESTGASVVAMYCFRRARAGLSSKNLQQLSRTGASVDEDSFAVNEKIQVKHCERPKKQVNGRG